MPRLAAPSRSFPSPRALAALAALLLAAASPARADADARTAPAVRGAAPRVVDFRPMDDGPKPPPPPNPALRYQPLTPDNFKGTPPANSPHDAELGTGVVLHHDSKWTTRKPDGKYESVPEGLRYESVVDESTSWKKRKAIDEKQEALRERERPTGTQAESRSSRSMHHDTASRRLSFTDDVFTRPLDGHDIPLPHADALLGAELLLLPTFLHVGETVGGDPFFLREGAAAMSTAEGAAFLAALRAAFDAGEPFLVGLRIARDRDFGEGTRGVTESASSPFTNGLGPVTSMPEPASATLLGAGTAALLACEWLRRRRAALDRACAAGNFRQPLPPRATSCDPHAVSSRSP